jgi:hypothetical protein
MFFALIVLSLFTKIVFGIVGGIILIFFGVVVAAIILCWMAAKSLQDIEDYGR